MVRPSSSVSFSVLIAAAAPSRVAICTKPKPGCLPLGRIGTCTSVTVPCVSKSVRSAASSLLNERLRTISRHSFGLTGRKGRSALAGFVLLAGAASGFVPLDGAASDILLLSGAMSPVLSTVPSGGGLAGGGALRLCPEAAASVLLLARSRANLRPWKSEPPMVDTACAASSGSANVTKPNPRPCCVARSLTTKALRTGPASLKCSSKAASVASYGSERTKTVVNTSFISSSRLGVAFEDERVLPGRPEFGRATIGRGYIIISLI